MFAASKTDSASTGGYQISRSLRFNSADSAYLNRTPASAGNRRTWTFSTWLKRSKSGDFRTIFSAATDTSNLTIIRFKDDDKIEVRSATSGSTVFQLATTQVFRDYSAWYHFVLAVDTTNATGGDRVRLYVNGSEVTTFDTDTIPTPNADSWVNNNILHEIARQANNASNYYQDGYMTEMYLIDGTQLTPSSFGETNAQTGVWQPKAYSGSYGTNGFYLNFSDNSNTTAATLGKDYSGNGNNWTPNNFSVTAGAGNDSLVDSPTSYGTDTGVGGTVRGNYSTWNPLTFYSTGTIPTFTNGNLDVSVPASAGLPVALGTFVMPSGQWYWEVTITSGNAQMVGIANSTAGGANSGYTTANGWYYYSGGQKYNNNVDIAYGTSFTVGDVIGIALDIDAGTLVFYKNGASQGTAYSTGLTGKTFVAALGNGASSTAQGYTGNFGQRAFAYTAPSGFKALCTQNLPTPTIGATTATQAGKYFNTVLYTGNGATQSVSGVGFQPDFTWIKRRDTAQDHNVYDSVRGSTSGYVNQLITNATNAENSYGAGVYGAISAFSSDGFSVASSNSSWLLTNASGGTYVGWNWKANGAGSTNTAGTVTSTVSANTTAGFSVVTWTGSSAGQTVGHGLGVAPNLIIAKSRTSGAEPWPVYISNLGVGNYLLLNSTAAANATYPTYWGSSAPTSTIFGTFTGGYPAANNNGSMVAYCFAPVSGYSAFGSFVGNGSATGPFIYTGFRPRFVMIKIASGPTYNTDNWFMFDTARGPYNDNNPYLLANTSGAEGAFTAPEMLSNGFCVNTTSNALNYNGSTYIYMAFAETPQKFALAR